MANQKTTTSLISQEQSVKTAVQSQLARIKKEEEEDLWISGEELYTEGSSDEEEYKAQTRSRRKVNSNQSSRASSTNPSAERRGHSPASAETKAKSERSAGIAKDAIIESQTVSKNVSKSEKISTSFEKSALSLAIESQRIQRAPKSSASSITRDLNSSSDFFTEEDQVENTEISWKANRDLKILYKTADVKEAIIALTKLKSYEQTSKPDTEFLRSLDLVYKNEELFEDESQDDISLFSIDTNEERVEKEMLKVKSLDNLIQQMSHKIQKANENTLFYQCENRKRLKNTLSLRTSETGKLAENTLQFFQLCPKYMMLNEENQVSMKTNQNVAKTDFHNNNKLNISLETNDFKQQAFKDENISRVNHNNELIDCDLQSLNITEKEKWKIMNLTSDDKMVDFDSNPFVVDKESKEMLLELEKNVSVT